MTVEFVFAARTDVGLVRKNNQDSAYAGTRLLVVADGMGGAAGGDIASSIVVAHLAPLDDAPGTADSLLANLTDALQSAHDEMVERTSVDERLKGLGTTCTAILRSENKLAMAHIGDSRAYLLRSGRLIQVTSDHSFVQYLIDTGQITKEEAETHPKRSVILRVLGDTPGPVAVDETLREAVPGDRWLLCSDGLSGVVSDETIENVLNHGASPGETCDKLVELALLAGAPDNVTCIIADVVQLGTAPDLSPQVVGAAAIDRNAPSKGSTGAAGRAAAISAPTEADEAERQESAEDSKPKQKRAWLLSILLILIMAAVVSGVAYAWRWSQQQYFVLGQENRVVVFQGIPQQIGSWELSRPIEITDLALDDLAEVDRVRLEDPVVRSTMEEVDLYLNDVRGRIVEPKNLVLMGTSPGVVSENEPQSGDS